MQPWLSRLQHVTAEELTVLWKMKQHEYLLQQASGGFKYLYRIHNSVPSIQNSMCSCYYSLFSSKLYILIIKYKCRNGMWMHNTKTCYCMRAGTCKQDTWNVIVLYWKICDLLMFWISKNITNSSECKVLTMLKIYHSWKYYLYIFPTVQY